MSALSDLQSRVSNFVLGNVALGEFCDWFVDRLWDVERSNDSEAIAAFYKVEAVLAEASHAHWKDSGLRDELAAAILLFAHR